MLSPEFEQKLNGDAGKLLVEGADTSAKETFLLNTYGACIKRTTILVHHFETLVGQVESVLSISGQFIYNCVYFDHPLVTVSQPLLERVY